MRYTLAQFLDYLGLSYQRSKRDRRWLLLATRLGFVGGEGLTDALKALDD